MIFITYLLKTKLPNSEPFYKEDAPLITLICTPTSIGEVKYTSG